MHAVYIRLERPRQKLWPVRRPEQRSDERHGGSRQDATNESAPSRNGHRSVARRPTENAHEHHRQPEDVQDIHAQQIAPGRPGITEGKFLCAKKQAHAENFRAAENGLLCDGVTFDTLLAQALRDQGKRDPRKKNEERRGNRSEEHTSELQSPCNLVCRLLLEKKKKKKQK